MCIKCSSAGDRIRLSPDKRAELDRWRADAAETYDALAPGGPEITRGKLVSELQKSDSGSRSLERSVSEWVDYDKFAGRAAADARGGSAGF